MSDKPVLTINPWLPSLLASGYSKTIVAGAFNEVGAQQDVFTTGIGRDDFFIDPVAGTIRLMPNPLRPKFWKDQQYVKDWLQLDSDSSKGRASDWRIAPVPSGDDPRLYQINDNVIVTQSPNWDGYINLPITPSNASLASFFTSRRADPSEYVWIAETVDTFPANCGFAVKFNIFESSTAIQDYPITISFGQFVLDIVDSSIAILYMYTGTPAKWKRVSTFVFSAQPMGRGPSDINILIIPGGYSCISILFSGSSLDYSRMTSMLSGKVLCNVFNYTSAGITPQYDSTEDMNVTTQPGPLVIGTSKNAGIRFSVAPIKYATSDPGEKTLIIGPYNLIRQTENTPTITAYTRKNGCGSNSITFAPCSIDDYGNAYRAGIDIQLGIKIGMRTKYSTGAFHSPEIFAINYEVPPEWTQEAPAGHPTCDASSKWQLIEFNRSVQRPGGKFNAKLIENGRGSLEDGFLRVMQTLQLSMPVETAPGEFEQQLVCSGLVEVSKPKFTGGIYSNQIVGVDLLDRLHKRPVGNFKALSGLNLKELILTALEASGIYREYIYWNSQLGDIDASFAPNDWYLAIENQTWGTLLENCLKQYSDQLRIVVKPIIVAGRLYLIQVYSKPAYQGVCDLAIYDYDCNASSPDFWHRAMMGVFKTKNGAPDFAVQGARYHRLYGIGSSSTGPEAMRLCAFMDRNEPRVWTDPSFYDYEGECKTHFISAPDLWAGSQSGINKAVMNQWQEEGKPSRLCQFDCEYHPKIDIDKFFRLFTDIGYGPCDAGAWRIVDMDVEMQGPGPDTWTAKLTGEIEAFGEVGL